MAKRTQIIHTPSKSNIDLGEERKARINYYRRQSKRNGTRLPKIDDAVNLLVDLQLDAEGIPKDI